MKKTLIAVVLILFNLIACAQTKSTTVNQFIKFYALNQVDSIFGLFSPEMKTALKSEGTKQLVLQLRQQLGPKVVNIGSISGPSVDVKGFRLSFEIPIADIALFIKEKEVVGIQQIPVSKIENEFVESRSNDNYNIESSSGTIYGTLMFPAKADKFPVVLMVGGSGPTDRNMNQGNMLKTNSFFMIADSFAANGIASVRFDKRGVGKSMNAGKNGEVTMDDYINDVDHFISKLKSDPRFSQVILLGHSEGSTIAMVAALNNKPDAYISLCGPSNNMVEKLKQQLTSIKVGQDDATSSSEILDSLMAGKINDKALSPKLAHIFSRSNQHYLISSIKYKPLNIIARLDIPILIVGGTTDLQISIEDAHKLAKANPIAELKIVDGMNHVLKRASLNASINAQTYNSPSLVLHKDIMPLLIQFVKKVSAKK